MGRKKDSVDQLEHLHKLYLKELKQDLSCFNRITDFFPVIQKEDPYMGPMFTRGRGLIQCCQMGHLAHSDGLNILSNEVIPHDTK
jgi:hypothetical protein